MMVGMLQSDWLKGFFLLLFWYIPPLYYCGGVMNKCVRRCRGIRDIRDYPTGTKFLPEPYDHLTTRRISSQLAHFIEWNWTSVLSKSIIIGILVWTMNVGCTVGLNLMLVWMDGWMPENPYVTVCIWYVFGLLCFLLPPVPGPPVYIFGGLVCVDAFKKDNKDDPDFGFYYGLIFMCFASWILKLNACVMQQKCIGEPLGQNDTIRAIVGVHKPFFRAVEIILRQPGVPSGKAAILCGGPDWPTSVLCGILKCNIRQIIIGTTPIFFFVAPAVCAGAFMRRTGQVYTTLTSMLIMVASLLAVLFFIYASFAIQEVLDNHGPLLQVPLERNYKLDWLDYKSSRKTVIYQQVTKWSNLSIFIKIICIFIFLTQSGTAYLFYWMFSKCFGDTDVVLSDETKSLTWDKNIANKSENRDTKVLIVTDLGIYGNAAFFSTCFMYYLYLRVLSHKAKPLVTELETQLESVAESKEIWEKEQAEKRDRLEKEMLEFYPDDYEVYLLQTGRQPLEGYDVQGWGGGETQQLLGPGNNNDTDTAAAQQTPQTANRGESPDGNRGSMENSPLDLEIDSTNKSRRTGSTFLHQE